MTELYHHNTPLHIAARNGRAAAVKVLLAQYAMLEVLSYYLHWSKASFIALIEVYLLRICVVPIQSSHLPHLVG